MSVGNHDSLVLADAAVSVAAAEILLPNHLPRGFDYAIPAGTTLKPGDYVRVPFGSREMAGVAWGPSKWQGDTAREMKLKSVAEHYAHLPPMSDAMRSFIDWAAWYTFSPRGAVLKMALPIPEALKAPSARERSNLSCEVASPQNVALSEDQQSAAATLAEKLSAGFSVTLLDGVTGSGKTEVYFDSIARVIASGGQALVLLPEISLSVQWLERFRARFGFSPVAWHSGLAPGLRKHTWRAIVNGDARVIVGARSALFLPYKNLRLIVVDEEHDSSYKQEDGVIYHARDMAVARARFEKIPAVLVSATPSLETYQNVKNGKYGALHLGLRHAGAQMPDIVMLDMRSVPLERGAFISQPLREALAEALSCGHQSMLFLNRRGYAPLVLCRTCGHRFQCPQCTSWLVQHKTRPRLQCHHCGYNIPPPSCCPQCHAEGSLSACGPGVERVGEEVAQFLPKARVAVLASDSADSFAALQERIHAMERGEIDILIGTQMVAKGHHFAQLALVGVVDADLGLAGGDLRAAERTYQLLHQLSGRAGREAVAGRVLIQSYQPDHPVMQALLSGQRENFMQLELSERERSRMPPFSRLCALIVEGGQETPVLSLARDLARLAPKQDGVQLLGPAAAPLYLLRGKYRQRLLLRVSRDINLQSLLAAWLGEKRLPHTLRVKVDVDPYSFL